MGNWSETIMGGDGPLDAQAEILRRIGFDDQDGRLDHADHPGVVRDLFDRVPVHMWGPFFAEDADPAWSNDKCRVAALLIMQCGARMPMEVSAQALEACKEDTSSWRSPQTRAFYLDQLAHAINGYAGTPTLLPQEGLFEKIIHPKPLGPVPTLH